jgi:hypothetical protein
MENIADRYIKLVCDYVNLSPEIVLSESRNEDAREARQLIMYILRSNAKMTLAAIGIKTNRVHATVLSAVRKVPDYFQYNKDYRGKYSPLLSRAQRLEAEIDAERKGCRVPQAGELCWFWNDQDDLPVLSRLLTIDKVLKVAYAENMGSRSFANWQYVSIEILPKQFRTSLLRQLIA